MNDCPNDGGSVATGDNGSSMGKDQALNPAAESRTVIPFPNACEPSPAHQGPLNAGDRALLEAARWWLIKSKLTPRAVIDEACFLLANGIPCETSAYASAFFRLLDVHAKREVQFFAIGVRAVTSDELWFLQLLNAAIYDDRDSVDTLIGWRLDAPAWRRAVFLISQLGQLLQKNDLENGGDVVI